MWVYLHLWTESSLPYLFLCFRFSLVFLILLLYSSSSLHRVPFTVVSLGEFPADSVCHGNQPVVVTGPAAYTSCVCVCICLSEDACAVIQAAAGCLSAWIKIKHTAATPFFLFHFLLLCFLNSFIKSPKLLLLLYPSHCHNQQVLPLIS